MKGPKLSNFEIGKPILQNGENRGTTTAIKLFYLYKGEKLLVRLK